MWILCSMWSIWDLSASFGLYVSSFDCLCKPYALTWVTIVFFINRSTRIFQRSGKKHSSQGNKYRSQKPNNHQRSESKIKFKRCFKHLGSPRAWKNHWKCIQLRACKIWCRSVAGTSALWPNYLCGKFKHLKKYVFLQLFMGYIWLEIRS